ncbi:hypothetical protein [Fictibacillus phosphorivorans]|uniref:hypothetical protein n=1 Tax=Fictibacillus phosphorivorans TaxID=1221500 RepID=UPI0020407BFD|nr:hypothetical protein [Fictibacillus phosphorivorans]MCM3717386.1 hypothetical protein [Fictibacillus phosphorivorans]MCM3775081.1 hypothetical protein [Fictibacillus phosphorivorans]
MIILFCEDGCNLKTEREKSFFNLKKRWTNADTGDSAHLWFERLKLNSDEALAVLQAYEKVRYGEKHITNDEFSFYAKAIKNFEKSEHLQKKVEIRLLFLY